MSRLLDASKNKDDIEDLSLRPQTLDEYVGQKELKDNFRVFIGAAKHRDEVLDHVLLYGPPGLGKTTLANVIANEMGAQFKVVTGPSIEKTGDLIAILNELEPGDVLFIDEIHRLPKVIEEVLYSAMEDFKISIVFPKDGGASSLNLDLNPFTLIGATTRAGDLTAPLRARFGITEKLNYYTDEEIANIIKRTSKVFKTTIDNDAVKMMSSRSRGTPRIANRLFKRVRDFANYKGSNNISKDDATKALNALKVDCLGLDDVDVKYLEAIIDRFHGGPVGLEALASSIGEEIMNLEDVYEPFLLQIGMINRTPRGRVATDKAYAHLEKYHNHKLL